MKKINAQFHPFLLLLLLVAAAALTLLATNAQKTEYTLTAVAVPVAVGGCNATRTADCLADEEFLMESEISRRLLAGRPNTVTYNTFHPTRSFCNRDTYGSCIGKESKNYKKRPCDYKNQCGRKP